MALSIPRVQAAIQAREEGGLRNRILQTEAETSARQAAAPRYYAGALRGEEQAEYGLAQTDLNALMKIKQHRASMSAAERETLEAKYQQVYQGAATVFNADPVEQPMRYQQFLEGMKRAGHDISEYPPDVNEQALAMMERDAALSATAAKIMTETAIAEAKPYNLPPEYERHAGGEMIARAEPRSGVGSTSASLQGRMRWILATGKDPATGKTYTEEQRAAFRTALAPGSTRDNKKKFIEDFVKIKLRDYGDPKEALAEATEIWEMMQGEMPEAEPPAAEEPGFLSRIFGGAGESAEAAPLTGSSYSGAIPTDVPTMASEIEALPDAEKDTRLRELYARDPEAFNALMEYLESR